MEENVSKAQELQHRMVVFAAETKYWFQLIGRLQPNLLGILHDECQSILMILQKTVNTINEKVRINDQWSKIK